MNNEATKMDNEYNRIKQLYKLITLLRIASWVFIIAAFALNKMFDSLSMLAFALCFAVIGGIVNDITEKRLTAFNAKYNDPVL